jgi:sporulation protein YlmC with PRC-barrel domain
MLKKLLITTALSGLMLSSALAQSSPPSASGDAIKSDAPAAGASRSEAAPILSAQRPDHLLASKIKGADVLGANNEKIGDVSDVVFSRDGRVEAYLISVGGFLGVGAKEVALHPSSVQHTQDKDTWKLKVNLSKDQLSQAPNFVRYNETPTTGAASAPSAMPRTGAPSGSPPASRP